MPESQKPFAAKTLSAVLVALAITALIVAFAMWRPWQTRVSPLTVGIATWPGFGPGFIAQKEGFFDGLDVQFAILDDFNARRAAFTSGQTQATVYTLDSLALEAPQGVPGEAVLILDESAGADAILARPEITKADDLIGKKVAYTRGSPSHFLLLYYLKQHKLSSQQIDMIGVDDPGRAGEALAGGSVDAAVTWEPNVTQLINAKKGHVLLSTKETPGLIVDILVVSPELLRDRPDDVRKLVAGWLKAIDFIKQHPDQSNAIMARELKIPLQEFPGMVSGLHFADAARNRELLVDNGGAAAIDTFDRAAAVWIEAGLNASAARGRDRVTGAYLPAAP